jgi:hypothetical protein
MGWTGRAPAANGFRWGLRSARSATAHLEGDVSHTIKAKPEVMMTPQELSEYYQKLCRLPASTKPLIIETIPASRYTQRAQSDCARLAAVLSETRAQYMKDKLLDRIWGAGASDEWDVPPKPKWMRWRTYDDYQKGLKNIVTTPVCYRCHREGSWLRPPNYNQTSSNRNLQFPGLRYPVIKKPCEHPKIAEDET